MLGTDDFSTRRSEVYDAPAGSVLVWDGRRCGKDIPGESSDISSSVFRFILVVVARDNCALLLLHVTIIYINAVFPQRGRFRESLRLHH